MPGGGTRLATTRNSPPPARCLDVTRLASRAGRALTGVDRVERAYLAHLLTLETPIHGLARVGGGYVLLDRSGLSALLDRVDGRTDWGQADVRARLYRRLSHAQRRADADLRRLAVRPSSRPGLGRMIRQVLPPGTAYLNVGHSNLTARVLRAFRTLPGARITVMIHDTIPLDYPDWQRHGTGRRFRAMLDRVAAAADLVVCNTDQTRADVARALWAAPRRPALVTAHLGVAPTRPAPGELPAGLPPEVPYFVAVGTIEPRKNHALLLDVWARLAAELGPDCPELLICGARGWRNEALFQRLDDLPAHARVREVPGLSDGALAALVEGAAALLQPSFAEGFGLPPVEAAALGTQVVCADLPVYRETLGDIPVYLPAADEYLWRHTIKSLAEADGRETATGFRRGFVPPSWRDHFNTVLRLT